MNWVKKIQLVGFALLIFDPAIASAQASGSLETGTLRPSRPAGGYGTSAKDVRQVVRTFSACVVSSGRGSVEKFLSSPIGSEINRRLQQRVLTNECLYVGEMRLSTEVMRGGLFEQLYLIDFASRSGVDIAKAPVVNYRAGYESGIPPFAMNAIALAEFGDCVTRRDPVAVKTLLLTLPGTSAETAQIQALSINLGPCIPVGQAIKFSPSVLRSGLAEGAYRVSLAAVGRQWGTSL